MGQGLHKVVGIPHFHNTIKCLGSTQCLYHHLLRCGISKFLCDRRTLRAGVNEYVLWFLAALLSVHNKKG